jgi:hypothetical protein
MSPQCPVDAQRTAFLTWPRSHCDSETRLACFACNDAYCADVIAQ